MVVRVLILFILWSSLLSAEAVTVYRKAMPDGSIQFSDEPFPGSEEIQVDTNPGDGTQKQITDRWLLQQQHKERKRRPQSTPRLLYQSIKITTPQPDQIVRSNGGTLNASVSIFPPLVEGDEIVFYVDGAVSGRYSSSSTQLSGIGNGRHKVSAAIVSGGKEVLRSKSVEFHLLRTIIKPAANKANSNNKKSSSTRVHIGGRLGENAISTSVSVSKGVVIGGLEKFEPEKVQKFVPGKVEKLNGRTPTPHPSKSGLQPNPN